MHEKILVTGAFGFLGQFVCDELSDRGYTNIIKVGNTEKSHQEPRHGWFLKEDGSQSIYGDLRNPRHVDTIIGQTNPDIVVHLAARVGGIGANQVSPGTFFYDNLKMGVELIERCRYLPDLQKFVLVSTVCSYPKFCRTPFKEDDIWEGYPEETNAPYGIAKKALMVMLQAYRKQYGMNGITLIPTNLYGPKDDFNPNTSHVIPALIHKVSETGTDGELTVWGTGNASREFLYVKDAARGIIDGMEKYDSPEPVNLGNGKEIKIKNLVDLICDTMGHTGKIRYDSTKPDGQPSRRLDISRAISSFDFAAQTDLADGLRETVDWYLATDEALLEC